LCYYIINHKPSAIGFFLGHSNGNAFFHKEGNMRKIMVGLMVAGLLLMSLSIQPVTAQSLPPLPPNCNFMTAPGSYSLICDPGPGKDWIVFAHGYVPEGAPPGSAWLQLILPNSTTTIPELVLGLGYGFAASAYNKDGLAIEEGITDTVHLAQYLLSYMGANRVYLVGASEGGLITTLIIEDNGIFMTDLSNPFTGGVALCGPIGDFGKQLDYFGDFRVLFDYFFPDILPGDAINVPPELTLDWLEGLLDPSLSNYQSAVIEAVSNPAKTRKVDQLMKASKAAYVPGDISTVITTTLDVLKYDVVGMQDAINVIGLQPFSNLTTVYYGSRNDRKLNKRVDRFTGDPGIAEALAPYQTTGILTVPLVTMHTTLDQQVPSWHQLLYRFKVWGSGSAPLYTGIPITRYGHCNFTAEEMVFAFYLMVFKSTGVSFTADQVEAVLPGAESMDKFVELQKQESSLPELTPGNSR
jgi:hypothetical protein